MYIINTNVLEILEQSTLDKDIHTIHTSEGDFSAQVKMTTQGSLYASNAVMIEVEIRGDHRDLKRKEITYTREIASEDVNSGTSEMIDYGTFVVLEVDYDISSEKTTLVCYDLMVKTQQEYDSELFTYPTTVHNLLLSLASACDLELDTNTYKGSNLPITSDVWVNASYTYRDILNHIAQLTTNTIKMQGDKLHLFDYEDTGVQLNRFANLKIGEDYGHTNILNISYEPQRDNVFSPTNANDIPKDERKELAFVNNPIFMGNEQSYADTLLPQLTDMTYATSEFKLYHGGIFQVGDMVEVYNGTEYVKTLITQQVLDSSNVQSEYVSSVPFSFKSEYVVETDVQRQGQTTYFVVDKQNGVIEGLVGRVTEVESQTATLRIEVDKIQTEVSEVNLGSILMNANGELDSYQHWESFATSDGIIVFDGIKVLENMTSTTIFEILNDPSVLGGTKLSFFGNGKQEYELTPILNEYKYSYRARRIKGTQSRLVEVNEYDVDKMFLRKRSFTFTGLTMIEDIPNLEFGSDVYFISLTYIISGVSVTNRLEIAETMFAIGSPKLYYKSTDSVYQWATSNFTMLSDEISLKVDVDGVISSINLSQGNATIDADKINLNGTVTANNNFKINTDGTVEMVNAKVSGKLEAGTIAGFTFNANSINYKNVAMSAREVGVHGSGFLFNDKSNLDSEGVFINSYGSIFASNIDRQIDMDGNYGQLNINADYINSNDINVVNKFSIFGGGEIRGNYGTGNGTEMILDSTRLYLNQTFVYPGDFTHLGWSDKRYAGIYLSSQPNVSSDVRIKYAIQEIPKDLIKVLYDIKPKMYLQGKEWHFGYIAQDVERALYRWATSKYGLEAKYYVDKFAMLHKDESMLSLLYGELSVLKEQYLLNEIEKLKERVDVLNGN